MAKKQDVKPKITRTKSTPLGAIRLNEGEHGLPKNPRLIKDERFKDLCSSVEADPEFMPVRPIVVDEDGIILAGNMRWRACKELEIDPLPAGWVIQVKGWTLEKKKRFILKDNNQYGEFDWELLGNEWEIEELLSGGFSKADLEDLMQDIEDNPYTRKVESPVYEITTDKPEVWELYDTDKQNEILAKIAEHDDLPEDIRDFLEQAASRHVRYDYSKIAEFYAHSSKEVQKLFEDSILVIVDFGQAIDKGFVKLADDVMALYQEVTANV